MLKKAKQFTLGTLKVSRALALSSGSRWRQSRLLILGYHGVSHDDEHLWHRALYMSAEQFRRRLRLLKQSGASVLPLGEAIERLYANDLPSLSVALTFDDGNYDFYKIAYPIIKEFDFPVTVYLTTYYSGYNRPVFPVSCNYLLWKGRERTIDLKKLTGESVRFDLSMREARAAALERLVEFARDGNLSAAEKDHLAERLAGLLEFDYQRLLSDRLLHLMTPAEVAELARDGVDFQLHTHRHCTPADRDSFIREIEDNRRVIREITAKPASHLCYPSGVYEPRFLPWLEEAGVASATTCEPGLATSRTNRFLLPRLVDTSILSDIEFEGWLSGLSSILPRRAMKFPGPLAGITRLYSARPGGRLLTRLLIRRPRRLLCGSPFAVNLLMQESCIESLRTLCSMAAQWI